MVSAADPQRDRSEQVEVVIPSLTSKDLLSAIPSHCFKRSALRSSLYIVWDLLVIFLTYKAATFLEKSISPQRIYLPHPWLYSMAHFSIWALYTFIAGLFSMGLWVIAHECGHQAFSSSKVLNTVVGFILHSALGVPYHSWRITHAQHHASNCHMTQDQVFIPWTRADYKLPESEPVEDDSYGGIVPQKMQEELWEALGDTPLQAAVTVFVYLIAGVPMYFLWNEGGQPRYPRFTSHFNPNAAMFKPHQRHLILWSGFGILCWLTGIVASSYHFSFLTTFKIYIAPYLWVNHWLVVITLLQHTDPVIPHYHANAFTFARGALSTLDRSLLGDLGPLMGWLGAHATHGISETHVLHHVCSTIPHYNAWEASDALHKVLRTHGINLKGRPGGWAELYRIFRACKFVENGDSVVFYKNARGFAAARPVFPKDEVSDSGVEAI